MVLRQQNKNICIVPRRRWGGWLRMIVRLMFMLLSVNASAEPIPELPEISAAVAAAAPDLIRQRAELVSRRNALRDRVNRHNVSCGEVEEGSAEEEKCLRAYEDIAAGVDDHINESNKYLRAYNAAVQAVARMSPKNVTPPKDEEDMIKSMVALAKRLRWSDEELARLVKALNELDFDGDPSATVAEKRQTWQAMLNEGRGEAFRFEAAKGEGPRLQWIGAGEQKYNDCTIFALANASGVPYGVVAGMAAELVRQGDWHAPATRNNPQELMEKKGLNGGEVVMLAESLGQAEVVSSADFPKVLKDGRPVLVNVASQNGTGGHQVVLAKTFHYKGKTWYEMMDSNQGAQKRLYLNAGELDIILKENGIAFRPEPGRTPKLLR